MNAHGQDAARTCTSCGADDIDPGIIQDDGQGSSGAAKWVQGPVERGMLGRAKVLGKSRLDVQAYRCRSCGHLELFAG